MDYVRAATFIEKVWDESVIPTLVEYIRIPNKSPDFEPDWDALGFMDQAADLLFQWVQQEIAVLPGAYATIERLPELTPVILIDIPASNGVENPDTVLLYGHFDKQPEMVGWDPGKGPWIPVLEGDRLYGRGGADDGYAVFSAITAVRALYEQGVPHGRCVVLIEASEESGSRDLPFYVEHLGDRLGNPYLVVCLDSGCGDYDRLWLTTSLRGMVNGVLRVDVLEEGVHSGDASGIVPSSFRIMRLLLDRLEDSATGRIVDPAFNVEIPSVRLQEARKAAEVLGEAVHQKYPFLDQVKPISGTLDELILNRTWRPALAVTGVAGAPHPSIAGNVLLPFTEAKLSLRLPPSCNAAAASKHLAAILQSDPPNSAQVIYTPELPLDGWDAPPLEPWLREALNQASIEAFGQSMAMVGEGGSIPFIASLQEQFPDAQFVVTGLLGPKSNAHGPNEFLHIPTAKKLTQVVASVVAASSSRVRRKGSPAGQRIAEH